MSFEPVRLDHNGQVLYLHPAPGLTEDLPADISVLKAAGVSAVITLLTEEELEENGLRTLGDEVRLHDMHWFHLPIRDFGTPDEAFEAAWPDVLEKLREVMDAGGAVSIHCKGGRGRTGIVAAKLLLAEGGEMDAVTTAVKAARAGALEDPPAMEYLKTL